MTLTMRRCPRCGLEDWTNPVVCRVCEYDFAQAEEKIIQSLRKGRADFDDDVVRIYDPQGEVVYEGAQDMSPYAKEDWRFDSAKGVYRLEGGYIMGLI